MWKIVKIILITIGGLGILGLCAPLLIGTMFWFTSRSQYNAMEPSKVSTLRIPDADITISLFQKQRPRAICYEGEYRVLEVSRPAKSNLYFELLPTSAGDQPALTAYWFPAQQCLKVVDSGSPSRSGGSFLFLDSATSVHLHGTGNGPLMTMEPKAALAQLQFPSASAQLALSFTESSVAIPKGDGIFVGTLDEKPGSKESPRQSAGASGLPPAQP